MYAKPTEQEYYAWINDKIFLDYVHDFETFNENNNESFIDYDDIRIEFNLNSIEDPFTPDKEKEIVLYCRSGRRSAIAKKALVELGYKDVKDFGGINRWQGELVK